MTRHPGYTACGAEYDESQWLTEQVKAISRAVNGRK